MIKFTDEQLDIINSPLEGNYLVSASAGGSKSTTLVQRVKHMIDCGVNPSEICIISYTKESANDLKKKLTKLNIEGVSCSTVHSLAFKICLKNDYSLSDKVIKPWQIEKIFYNIEKETGMEINADSMISIINFQKCNLIGVDGEFKSINEEPLNDMLVRICYKGYEDEKNKLGLIDFNDMVLMAINKIEKSKYKLFKYLIGDEFQDASPLTHKFVELLSGKENVTLFYDVKQSIYGFLSATPELIKEFPNKYKNTQIKHLSNNFRSCKNIVESANNFVEDFYKNDKDYKRQIPTIKRKGEITVNNYINGYEEGLSVLERIKDLHEQGVEYKDMMVIYRNNSQSNTIQLMLKGDSIPYTCNSDGNMFKYKEIDKCIKPMLKLIIDRNDDLCVEKIFEVRYGKFKYLKNSSISLFKDYANRTGMSLYQAMLEYHGKDYKLMQCFEWFTKQLDGFKLTYERTGDLNRLIKNILSMFDIYKEIESYDDEKYESIDSAINVLLGISKDTNIENFIKLIESNPKKKNSNKNKNAVKLTTVHSSKGLESSVVFLIGVDNEKFPSSKNSLEEEIRLFYVGITRAIDKLIVSSTNPSVFIERYKECIDK